MPDIPLSLVTEAVARLCVKSNIYLNADIDRALNCALQEETAPLGRYVLETLCQNAVVAATEQMPICQDTGMAVVFLDIGQDVHFTGGLLTDAVEEGVRQGYQNLRKSVVRDPIHRDNTGDNSPAVLHIDIIPGDKCHITVAPKGFGSENMSALGMLTPSEGLDGVKNFVIDTVRKAGGNPCPPIVVGVGVGGTMEKACLMAKRALLRPVDEGHGDPFWRGVEEELLTRINELDIGPGGFHGRTTALGVNIQVFPTHIAGLPVAVNIGCHVTRHGEEIIG